jgi:branched-chain amino acid transport system permease protein
MYYFVLAVAAGSFFLIYRTVHSPFGQVLKGIRENEARVRSLGYDVERFKILAVVLSAALSGLAGATKAVALGFETLVDVHWHMSGEVVLMTMIGGVGTLLGPTVGAFVVVGLESTLSDKVGSWVTVIMGAMFMACVLLFRKGVVGQLADLFKVRSRPVPEIGEEKA